MSNQHYATFLPTDAIEHTRPSNLRHNSDGMVSPRAPRRGLSPSYIPQKGSKQGGGENSSYFSPLTGPPTSDMRHASSPHNLRQLSQNDGALFSPSPPISRAGSSDAATAALVEDWRAFTRKLREQHKADKAHMEESRLRSEEIMAEERALWDKERANYERRIAELEEQLPAFTGPLSSQGNTPHPASYFASASSVIKNMSHPSSQLSSSGVSPHSVASGTSQASKRAEVAQESGRCKDGTFFYAPVSQHPTRTFSPTSTELRVDSLHVPGETPLHVTAKELTAADFLSPPMSGTGHSSPSHKEGSVVGDSIDISVIAPSLEGVPIRSSAVEPTFIASVKSPGGATMSPSRSSPDVEPPPRPVQNYDRGSPEAKRRGSTGSLGSQGSPKRGVGGRDRAPRKTLEIIKQPVTQRLTMHAGHTPNHSIIQFELGNSGLTTPKASAVNHEVSAAEAAGYREEIRVYESSVDGDDGDHELTGPLGLMNAAGEDDAFLKALTHKLEEVKDMEGDPVSVTTTGATEDGMGGMGDAEVLATALRAVGRGLGVCGGGDGIGDGVRDSVPDDVPILKLKPSVNFGRPLGHL